MKPKPQRPPQRRKKLRAAASGDFANDWSDEPNMRLSRAFIVVLILHVVAVGGILIFNNIQPEEKPSNSETAAEFAPPPAKTATEKPKPKPRPKIAARKQPQRQNDREIEELLGSPPPAPRAPSGSGKTHVVQAGENPYAIAQEYGVDYQALLEINSIENPRAVPVGAVLELPEK